MTRNIRAPWPSVLVGSWLFLFLFLGCAAGRSQPQTGVADYFVDPVGKSYLLLHDNRLVTENPLGQNRFEFYDSSLGQPDGVDVTNPFAILLFYADYGTVVVLDRTLSEVSRVDLFSLDWVEQPTAAARASDNGIWIFDSWDYRLKLLDPQGKERLKSNDLRLEIGQSSEPVAIYVDRGNVTLHYAEVQKLAVFTNYGHFEGWVQLPAAEIVGWYSPWLTGTDAEGNTWSWRAGQQEARPQVQSGVKGKVLTAKNGFYRMGDDGRIRFTEGGID